MPRLSLIACDSGREFAEKILEYLKRDDENGFRIVRTKEYKFDDGEIKTRIEENVRGDDVFIVQCFDDPRRRNLSEGKESRNINDNLMALITAIGAAKASDVHSITIIIPYYHSSRQDKRTGREAITAKILADLYEKEKVKRIITLDIHNTAIEGFFSRTVLVNLHASNLLIDHFLEKDFKGNVKDLVVFSPDAGSLKRSEHYAFKIGCPVVSASKDKDYSHKDTFKRRIVFNKNEVKEKSVLIADDMVATGGTLISTAKEVKDAGAKEVYLLTSLPKLNGSAIDKFNKAYKKGLFNIFIGTDAIPFDSQFKKNNKWYHEVSVASLFAEVIKRINKGDSVSALLG